MNNETPEIRTNNEGQREYLLGGETISREAFEAYMATIVRKPNYQNMMAGYRAKVRVARERETTITLSPTQLEMFLDIVERRVRQ